MSFDKMAAVGQTNRRKNGSTNQCDNDMDPKGEKRQKKEDNDNVTVLDDLIQWIRDCRPWGYVHPHLSIRHMTNSSNNQDDDDEEQPQRGVYANKPIRQGETLVVLPESLVISGKEPPPQRNNDNHHHQDSTLPKTTKSEITSSASSSLDAVVSPSPWLKCIGRYYQAQRDPFYRPYLDSLPVRYDDDASLLAWSNDEIQTLLAGTALGHLVTNDRRGNLLAQRYQTKVRPYLLQLLSNHGIILPNKPPPLDKAAVVEASSSKTSSSVEEEMVEFRKACACVSSRGFHRPPRRRKEESSPCNDNDDDDYLGPYLLPLIDLLNHDPERQSTTLRYSSKNQTFWMQAERDIATDQEIVHSYGDGLTSGQLLQTFGFVPSSHTQRVLSLLANTNAGSFSSAKSATKPPTTTTPAVLSKSMVIQATQTVMTNPRVLQRIYNHLNQQDDEEDDEDETWELPSKKEQQHRNLSVLSDDHVLGFSNDDNDIVLTEELLTLCCVLLLPQDVYEEIFVETGFALLDQTALQDRFLGLLVCETLLEAIRLKRQTYTPLNYHNIANITTTTSKETKHDNDDNNENDDAVLLQRLWQETTTTTTSTVTVRRACYALTIRLEEKSCLDAMEKKVWQIQQGLVRRRKPNPKKRKYG